MGNVAKSMVCVLLLTAVAWADYPADRAAALKLTQAGKHEEALAQFLALADAAGDPKLKSDALAQAALCAQKLQRSQQAIELAQQIPLPSLAKLTQMRVLLADRAFEQVLSSFKDEDLSAWPEAEAGEAHFLRGVAALKSGQGELAEAELAAALKQMGEGSDRAHAALMRADNFRSLLKDNDKARQAYAEVQQMEVQRARWGWIYLTGVVSEAEILREQGQFDEALAVLNRVNLAELSKGYWSAQMRVAHAQLLVARGQNPQALAMLRQALEISTQDHQKAAIQKQIDALAPAP